MDPTPIFVQFLEISITPVALISGVGLILLSVTNRLGRTIDRSRALIAEYHNAGNPRKKIIKAELEILNKRNRYLKTAMGGISFSILTSSLMIPVLLVMALLKVDLSWIGSSFLVLSIAGIITAAIYFFADVALSLKALDVELKEI